MKKMVQVTFQQEAVTLVGNELKVGDQAPDFTVLSNDLKEVSSKDYEGKVKLISFVPSVDTGVCSKQTKRFNDEAEKLDNVNDLTISMDLPFAQARWREVNDVKNVDLYTDHRNADFGEKYGVLMKVLRLRASAIFIVDSEDKITYDQNVDEGTDHPNYHEALAQAKKAK